MPPLKRSPFWCLLAVLVVSPPIATLYGSAERHFDIPAGPAEASFRTFSEQAAVELVFSVDKVAGEVTKAVKGNYAPLDALQRMLAGTVLVAFEDARTGALAIGRSPPSKQSFATAKTSLTKDD
jgi:hypothetical protein